MRSILTVSSKRSKGKQEGEAGFGGRKIVKSHVAYWYGCCCYIGAYERSKKAKKKSAGADFSLLFRKLRVICLAAASAAAKQDDP